jgi:hypothetical protein
VYQIFQPPASKTNFAEAAAVFEVVVSCLHLLTQIN